MEIFCHNGPFPAAVFHPLLSPFGIFSVRYEGREGAKEGERRKEETHLEGETQMTHQPADTVRRGDGFLMLRGGRGRERWNHRSIFANIYVVLSLSGPSVRTECVGPPSSIVTTSSGRERSEVIAKNISKKKTEATYTSDIGQVYVAVCERERDLTHTPRMSVAH